VVGVLVVCGVGGGAGGAVGGAVGGGEGGGGEARRAALAKLWTKNGKQRSLLSFFESLFQQ
jgi:hypothetical protein